MRIWRKQLKIGHLYCIMLFVSAIFIYMCKCRNPVIRLQRSHLYGLCKVWTRFQKNSERSSETIWEGWYFFCFFMLSLLFVETVLVLFSVWLTTYKMSTVIIVTSSALMLWFWWQEGHSAYKKVALQPFPVLLGTSLTWSDSVKAGH